MLRYALLKMISCKRPLLLAMVLLTMAVNASAAKTILAGGCFWCMEADFERLPGVTDVISGFSGGTLKDPTYSGSHEGHREVVEITYEPERISYKELLEYFWVNIDPFDAMGQFCDRGPSYLSAIFVANDRERTVAEETKKDVAGQFPGKKIYTPILPASTFYPVKGEESYHQDYYKKNSVNYRFYRWNCGRDRRLKEIWGEKATH